MRLIFGLYPSDILLRHVLNSILSFMVFLKKTYFSCFYVKILVDN